MSERRASARVRRSNPINASNYVRARARLRISDRRPPITGYNYLKLVHLRACVIYEATALALCTFVLARIDGSGVSFSIGYFNCILSRPHLPPKKTDR